MSLNMSAMVIRGFTFMVMAMVNFYKEQNKVRKTTTFSLTLEQYLQWYTFVPYSLYSLKN